MSKRLSVSLLALAMVLGLLSGCSGSGTKSAPEPNSNSGSTNAASPSPSTAAAPTTNAEAAPPADLNKKEGDALNLFNWSEYLPQEVLDDFTKEYGIKVNYDTYASNEEMAAKLQNANGVYDLVVPSTYMVQALAAQGLLQPVDLSYLPNFKNIAPSYKNLPHDVGNKFSVPYMWGTVGIAYNSKHVKTAPATWADVLNPALKGKVVALDDSREIMMVGLQASGFSRNETDPAKIKKAQDWLKQLVPNVLAWDSDNPKGALISGDAWVGIVWNGEAALAMQENADIKYVMPKDGGGLWLDSVVIPKGAKNVKNAHLFINYMLRPEVSAKIGSAYPYGLPNVEGMKKLDDATRANPASYPPDTWLLKAEYAADIGAGASVLDRAYTEVKASN